VSALAPHSSSKQALGLSLEEGYLRLSTHSLPQSLSDLCDTITTSAKRSTPDLSILPLEILTQICSYLPQHALHNLLFFTPSLTSTATTTLYRRPHLVSTYRLAQFFTTILESDTYASKVSIIIIKDENEEKDKKVNLAGWLEWRYRSHGVYGTFTEKATMDEEDEKSLARHQGANQFLREWSYRQTYLPVGMVLHVIAACKGLRLGGPFPILLEFMLTIFNVKRIYTLPCLPRP